MNDIDCKKYYDVKLVKYFDCFIGPNGEFYKVKNLLDINDLRTHYIWAEAFFKKRKLYDRLKSKSIDPLMYLINRYGFIRYSNVLFSKNPIIDIPNGLEYGTYINKRQIWSIYNLLYAKEEYLTKDQIDEIDNALEGNVNNEMANNYYVKRLKNFNL